MGDQDNRPRLEAVYFGDDASMYARMARVLRLTAQRLCSGWAINIRPIAPAPVKDPTRRLLFVVNTQKLDEWRRTILDASIGDRILLIDADTFITNPLDDIWDRDFDIAYTVRPHKFPFNGGVVFLRVTPETKAFVDLWWRENDLMLCDKNHHYEWANRFGGINQASFGYVITHAGAGMKLLELPCAEWNCENSSWPRFTAEVTRIVHVKSALRTHVFQLPHADVESSETVAAVTHLADRWHALEQEALTEEVDASTRR